MDETFGPSKRCDRCGAIAVTRAVLHAGDLMFCANHVQRHRDALYQQAMFVEDGSLLAALR